MGIHTLLLERDTWPFITKINIIQARGVPKVDIISHKYSMAIKAKFQMLRLLLDKVGYKAKFKKVFFSLSLKNSVNIQLSNLAYLYPLFLSVVFPYIPFLKGKIAQNTIIIALGDIQLEPPYFKIDNQLLNSIKPYLQFVSNIEHKNLCLLTPYKNNVKCIKFYPKNIKKLNLHKTLLIHHIDKLSTVIHLYNTLCPHNKILESLYPHGFYINIHNIKQIPSQFKDFLCLPIKNIESISSRDWALIQTSILAQPHIFATSLPCKCGLALHPKYKCTCSSLQKQRAVNKILQLCNGGFTTYFVKNKKITTKTLKNNRINCTNITEFLTL